MGWVQDLEESFWASGSVGRPTGPKLLPEGVPRRQSCCGSGHDGPLSDIDHRQIQPLHSHVIGAV